ncbi:hypothetical protein MNBD_PLANCTO02-340 [hydrothermal vent metagenome]|uniref:DUF1697 domain-containing protein n=1 Tax=hydrothermal vent metagenome TaxID=652676 RepID=A0A3B1DKI1_9ZZZZ
MNIYIALLRGINIGGKNKIPMKELKALLEDNGYNNVQTYIQSGNVVFNNPQKPQSNIGELIKNNFGFSPEVLILSGNEFNSSVANNPYQEYEGKFVHFYFCKEKPKLNTEKINQVASDTEKYRLIGNVFYLHAPNGIARSKLVAGIEKCLGVPATGRNLNTINKLYEMVKNA